MPDRVVVFDTSCLLCSRFIQILLKNDRSQLQYTGFESTFSQDNLPAELIDSQESVVFYMHGRIYLKSLAVLAILRFTRWRIRWLRIFSVFPVKLLDWLYDWVARNRYAWFGQSESCYIPSTEQKSRFLD